MVGRSTRTRHLPPRRGVTLVIIAISLLVFLGFAALALDLTRLVNIKGELKGIADAAAMSAALDLAGAQSQAQATANVSTLVSRNPIAGTGTATVVEVTGVTWNNDSSRIAALPAWNIANGVRVVTRYPVNWILSQLFNQGTGRMLVDTSIAAIGRLRAHNCLRPFVLPYSALRSRLSLSPVADTTSLTQANIYALRSLTSVQTYTVLDTVNPANATHFGWANTRYGSTGSATDVVTALTSCASESFGVGSTLQARPRFGDTTSIRTAASTLCGSATTCTTGNRIMVPIYVSGTNGTGITTTTTTTTPAPNQSVSLQVNKNCFQASTSTTYSASRCSSFVSTLQTASVSSPVYLTSGSTTVACRAGPTYTGLGQTGNGNKAVYYLYFQYTNCVTTTTTTTGSGRAAASYVIKYIATFVWTARTNTTISGYFTTINLPPAGSGTWDALPGLVTSAVLVR